MPGISENTISFFIWFKDDKYLEHLTVEMNGIITSEVYKFDFHLTSIYYYSGQIIVIKSQQTKGADFYYSLLEFGLRKYGFHRNFKQMSQSGAFANSYTNNINGDLTIEIMGGELNLMTLDFDRQLEEFIIGLSKQVYSEKEKAENRISFSNTEIIIYEFGDYQVYLSRIRIGQNEKKIIYKIVKRFAVIDVETPEWAIYEQNSEKISGMNKISTWIVTKIRKQVFNYTVFNINFLEPILEIHKNHKFKKESFKENKNNFSFNETRNLPNRNLLTIEDDILNEGLQEESFSFKNNNEAKKYIVDINLDPDQLSDATKATNSESTQQNSQSVQSKLNLNQRNKQAFKISNNGKRSLADDYIIESILIHDKPVGTSQTINILQVLNISYVGPASSVSSVINPYTIGFKWAAKNSNFLNISNHTISLGDKLTNSDLVIPLGEAIRGSFISIKQMVRPGNKGVVTYDNRINPLFSYSTISITENNNKLNLDSIDLLLHITNQGGFKVRSQYFFYQENSKMLTSYSLNNRVLTPGASQNLEISFDSVEDYNETSFIIHSKSGLFIFDLLKQTQKEIIFETPICDHFLYMQHSKLDLTFW